MAAVNSKMSVLFFGSLFAGYTAFAECPELYSKFPDESSYMQQMSNSSNELSQSCSASVSLIPDGVSPGKEDRSRYRIYSFNNSGEFSVFVSTEDSPSISLSTGQRSFVLFPRKENLGSSSLQINDVAQEASFRSFFGTEAVFNLNTLELTSLAGFKVKFSNKSVLNNQGGVELVPEKGYAVLDFGWATGTSPISSRWAMSKSSKFVDGNGVVCSIPNSELIAKGITGEPEFKYKTDAEFKVLLKKRCPKSSF